VDFEGADPIALECQFSCCLQADNSSLKCTQLQIILRLCRYSRLKIILGLMTDDLEASDRSEIEVLSQNLHRGTEENQGKLIQGSRCSGRDLNQNPILHSTGVLISP